MYLAMLTDRPIPVSMSVQDIESDGFSDVM
jgi:hypothetical protein